MRARALRCKAWCDAYGEPIAAEWSLATCTCAPIAAFSLRLVTLFSAAVTLLWHTFTALGSYRGERAYPVHFATG